MQYSNDCCVGWAAGGTNEDTAIVLQCLDVMLTKRRKQVTLQRAQGFLKRLSTLSLHLLPDSSVGILAANRALMHVSQCCCFTVVLSELNVWVTRVWFLCRPSLSVTSCWIMKCRAVVCICQSWMCPSTATLRTRPCGSFTYWRYHGFKIQHLVTPYWKLLRRNITFYYSFQKLCKILVNVYFLSYLNKWFKLNGIQNRYNKL